MNHLPKFWECAQRRLETSSVRDRTITLKFAKRTCEMMVEAERNGCAGLNPAAYREVVEQLTEVDKALFGWNNYDMLRAKVRQALARAQEAT